MVSFKNKKLLKQMLVIFAVFGTIIILVDSLRFNKNIFEYDEYILNDNWTIYDQDKNIIEKPDSLFYIISEKSPKTVYLERDFDQDYFDNALLNLNVHEMSIWIYLDDKLIYEYQFLPTYINSNSPGTVRLNISLPNDLKGKKLVIKYLQPDSNVSRQVRIPKIIKAPSTNIFMKADEMIMVMTNNALMFLAVVYLVIYLMNRRNRKDLAYLKLSLFFSSVSIWMYCYNGILTNFTNNWVLIHNLEYISLYLIIFAYWSYFLQAWNYRPYFGVVLYKIMGIFFVVAIALKLFLGIDFAQYLSLYHLLIVINTGFVLFYCAYHFKRASFSFRIFALGTFIAICGAMQPLIHSYINFSSIFSTTLTIAGISIGSIFIAISIFYHVVEILNKRFEHTVKTNLETEYERYESIIYPTGNAFFVWNFVDNATYFSSNFNDYFQSNFNNHNFRQEFNQLNIQYDENIDLLDIVKELKGSLNYRSLQCYFTTKAGTKKWFIVDLSTSLDASGHKTNIFGMITDNTHEKELEQDYNLQLMHNDINKTLYDFVIEADVSNNRIINRRTNLNHEELKNVDSYASFLNFIATYYLDEADRIRMIEILSNHNLITNFNNNHLNFDFEILEHHPTCDIWYNVNVKLFKSNVDNTINVIIYGKNITSTKLKMLDLETRIDFDPLTLKLNKAAFEARCNLAIKTKPDALHALFVLDIDNFKKVNDRLGHVEGDKVILDFAKRMSQQFRDDDLIGRFGGDEFLILMTNVTDYECILKKAQSLRNHLEYTYINYDSNIQWKISSSIGIAIYPDDGCNYKDLFANADDALYQSKRNGKNNFTIYNNNNKTN